MTVKEIREEIKFKIRIIEQCTGEIKACPMAVEYFQGKLDAYNELLKELGGAKDAKTAQ